MKILYVNACMTEAGGEIFKKGVERGLQKSEIAKKETIEIIPFNIFYREKFSASHMGAFARAKNVDAVILSGSEKNTTDHDDPWLKDYYRGLADLLSFHQSHEDWHGPAFPVMGICFGHQALACLLGGETSRFSQKRGLIQARALPSAYDHPVFRSKLKEKNYIDFVVTHCDQVVRLPHQFVSLLTSDYCDFQGMAHQFWPVFSLQPHPEIIKEIKDEPEEAADWEKVSAEHMEAHSGSEILASFADWAIRF